jgi:hypothetical protein
VDISQLTMTITLGEGESALATFGAAFLGYLIQAGFIVSNVTVEHAAIVGGVAALGFLGYNVVAGNVANGGTTGSSAGSGSG